MSMTNVSPWPRLVAAVVIAVAASGCDVVVGGLRAKEVARNTWQQTFQLGSGGRFEAVNSNGRIEVEAVDGDAVGIVAERSAGASTIEAANDLLKQVEILVEQSSGHLRVTAKTPKGLGGHAEVTFKVTVPRLAAVQATTRNGTVKISGVKGAVRMESTNGTVVAAGLGGEVTAVTTNGSIEVEVDQVSGEGIRLETTNGAIELRLPKDAKADIRARAVNGGVRATDLQVESAGDSGRRRIEGRLNGGGPTVVVETVNGGVHLVGK